MKVRLLACGLTFGIALGAQILSTRPPDAPTGNGSIEGTVVNAMTQEPVRQAQVNNSANAPQAVTDSTGRFAFRNLAPGTYML